MQRKQWWKSKTVWINVLTVLGSVVVLASTSFDVSKQVLEWLLFSSGVVNILLRFLSGEPLNLPLKK